MKYFEVHMKNMVSISDDGASIAPAPDEEDIECLKVGEDVYLPFVGWMKYDKGEDSWVEIDQDEEEKIIATFSEDVEFGEVPEADVDREE